MAKSNLPKSGKVGKVGTEEGAALIRQLQQRFAGFWQRLSAPGDEDDSAGFVQEYLASLKERAYLERTIANQYRGRYLLELIQNAVDNMHRHAKSQKPKSKASEEPLRYRCHIELTPTTLYVANDGLGFEEADVRGICAMGQSTKPAGEYIGYKGLGFRAVLEITDAPEIYSGGYEFGFSRNETLNLFGPAIDQTKMEVPLLAVPHLRSTTSEELPEADREVLARLKKAGYATIIRLPLKQTQLYREVRDDCQQLLSSHTLLFLPYITELNVAIVEQGAPGSIVTISKTSREMSVRPNSLAELVRVARLGFQRNEAPFPTPAKTSKKGETTPSETISEDWLLVEPQQPVPIDQPELVTELEDPTWKQLKQVNLAVAFPLARMPWGGGEVFLKRRPEPLPFFAHFPTQEGSGLGFAVHADFYLSASRKQIEGTIPYNQWLTRRLVSFICGAAFDAVHYLHPDEAALVELLVDYSYYSDSFGRAFRETLDNKLAATAFVPIGNGLYMPPNRVVWTPLGGEGVLLFRRVFRYPGTELHYPVLQLEEVYAPNQAQAETTNRTAFDSDTVSYSNSSDYGSHDRDSYSDYNYSSSSSYEERPSSNYYNDPYADNPSSNYYDDEPAQGSGKNSKSSNEEESFDFKRIERFLSSLGVKKLPPAALSEIYGQALQGWEAGQVLTGEICAVLALWHRELTKGGFASERASRLLIEQAQTLRVLPTINDGWQAPENRHFIFKDVPPQFSGFGDENILPGGEVSFLEIGEQAATVAYIQPEAYELDEFAALVHNWHSILGVRSASGR